MKKVVKSILFFMILLLLVIRVNEIVVRKTDNRYYIMREEYQKNGLEHYDIAVFGSCHAYRTVNSKLIEQETGLSSYNFSNPSEIIPSTYLNMYDKFRDFTPKVALIETWGVHAYDSYLEQETIDGAFSLMTDSFPLSLEKIKLIDDFDNLDLISANFPLARYKSRFYDFEIDETDYAYSYVAIKEQQDESLTWLYYEMDQRMENNGYYPVHAKIEETYLDYKISVDYKESMPIEADLMKYVDKIIELCEENDVIPIFFRAPYITNENECKKNHYLEKYLKQKGYQYIDLEEEIVFDYQNEMGDLHHLNDAGATRATMYLIDEIEKVIKNQK